MTFSCIYRYITTLLPEADAPPTLSIAIHVEFNVTFHTFRKGFQSAISIYIYSFNFNSSVFVLKCTSFDFCKQAAMSEGSPTLNTRIGYEYLRMNE